MRSQNFLIPKVKQTVEKHSNVLLINDLTPLGYKYCFLTRHSLGMLDYGLKRDKTIVVANVVGYACVLSNELVYLDCHFFQQYLLSNVHKKNKKTT